MPHKTSDTIKYLRHFKNPLYIMPDNTVNSSFTKNLIKHTRWRVPQKESKFKYINLLIKRKYNQRFPVRKILFRT